MFEIQCIIQENNNLSGASFYNFLNSSQTEYLCVIKFEKLMSISSNHFSDKNRPSADSGPA